MFVFGERGEDHKQRKSCSKILRFHCRGEPLTICRQPGLYCPIGTVSKLGTFTHGLESDKEKYRKCELGSSDNSDLSSYRTLICKIQIAILALAAAINQRFFKYQLARVADISHNCFADHYLLKLHRWKTSRFFFFYPERNRGKKVYFSLCVC